VELVIVVGAFAMSILFFVLAGRFPSLAADPGGLSLFPRMVAVFTGLASAAFLAQAIRRIADRPHLEGTVHSAGKWLMQRRVEMASFAVVGLLPFAIQWLGFVAAVGIFTVLMLVISRVRLFPLTITALLTTAGIYVAYAIVLGAVLPNGQFWD
jgi:Tripartite tricarboxylate transporter TctB family